MATGMSAGEQLGSYVNRYLPTLEFIASITPTQFDAICDLISDYETQPGTKRRPNLIAHLGVLFANDAYPPGMQQDLVDAVLRLGVMQRVNQPSEGDPVDLLLSTLRGRTSSDVSLLGQRLHRLLDMWILRFLAGIDYILSESGLSVERIKIFTGVKPVFETVEGRPRSRDGLILHDMVIVYKDHGVERSLTVVLNEDDLRNLAVEVKRAEYKEEDVRGSVPGRSTGPGDSHQ